MINNIMNQPQFLEITQLTIDLSRCKVNYESSPCQYLTTYKISFYCLKSDYKCTDEDFDNEIAVTSPLEGKKSQCTRCLNGM